MKYFIKFQLSEKDLHGKKKKEMKKFEKIAQKYKKILNNAVPYILSHPGNFKYIDMAPWRIEIPEANRFSCLSVKNDQFYDLIHRLDALTYVDDGMAGMDKWIFFDCAEMPGGIFGFAVKSTLLDKAVLKKYNAPLDYEGLVPISMTSYIPKISKNEWVGLILASTSRILSGQFSGLGLLTKAMGLKCFNIKCIYGATQWGNIILHIYSQFSDMEILSAYTPAHTVKNTLVFRSFYNDEKLIDALSGNPRKAEKWDFLYPADDERFSLDIQKRIEKGAKYTITGRPVMREGRVFYPVSEA